MFWRRAYETKIWDRHREAVGRGPTPQAAQEAAEKQWVAEAQGQHEVSRDHPSAAREAASRGKVTDLLLDLPHRDDSDRASESNRWPKRSTDGRA